MHSGILVCEVRVQVRRVADVYLFTRRSCTYPNTSLNTPQKNDEIKVCKQKSVKTGFHRN